MRKTERIVCACGGELRRPVPSHCPHCGARIAAVRRRMWPLVWPLLLIAGMFAALLAYLAWQAGAWG
ncbi:MAG: hypothetical protein KDA41_05955 [Planctomycetales bacterium]|nr:hypothetical protein [Planctomycetales bacterium]